MTPPGTDPAAAPLVCVQFNATWLPYIVGALMQLVQPAAWATSDPTVLQTTLENATELISLFGTAEDCTMLTFQFTSGCVLQFSLDGGVTWEDVSGWPTFAPGCYTGATGATGPAGPAGGFDPGIPIAQPGQTTADLACAVAGYIATEVIQAAINSVLSGISTAQTIIQIATAFLLSVIGGPVIGAAGTEAVTVLYNAILGGDESHFSSAASDPTLWGDVTCAIYTATSGDGYVTSANYAAVQSAICAISYTYPDVVAAICDYMDALGYASVAALQVPGAVQSADCSGCGGPSNWCYEFNFENNDGGWTSIYGGTSVSWVSGLGWQSNDDAGGQYCAIEKSGFSGVFDTAEVFWTAPAGTLTKSTIDSYPSSGYISVNLSTASGSHDQTVAFAGTWTSVRLDLENTALTGSHIVISKVIFRGTGANPFGANNCV